MLCRRLAEQHGVTEKAVRDIWMARTWKAVTAPLQRQPYLTDDMEDCHDDVGVDVERPGGMLLFREQMASELRATAEKLSTSVNLQQTKQKQLQHLLQQARSRWQQQQAHNATASTGRLAARVSGL